MSETQPYDLQKDQAHLVQMVRGLQRYACTICLVRARRQTGNMPKPNAFWPLLLCVAVALRRVGVGWCGVLFVYVVYVVFVAFVFMVLFVWWVRQRLCWLFLMA